MLSRECEKQDWVNAVPYLVEAITRSPICLMQDIDIASVLAHLMDSATRGGAYIVGEKYLVVYDLHPLWYSPTSLTVNEQLVLNIAPDKPATIMQPIRFLVEEKVRHNAKHLLVGDLLAANQDKYGRVLTKLGLNKVNSLYAT